MRALVAERRACARGACLLCCYPFLGDAMCAPGDCGYRPVYVSFECARVRFREDAEAGAGGARVGASHVRERLEACEDIFSARVSEGEGRVTCEVRAGRGGRARALLFATSATCARGIPLGLRPVEESVGEREALPVCECCCAR